MLPADVQERSLRLDTGLERPVEIGPKYRGNIVGIVIPFLETIVNENVTNESKQLLQKSLIRV